MAQPPGRALRVVVAPDAFKGTIGAADVASALAAGWRDVRPSDHVVELGQADGGEGTASVLAAAVPGSHWRAIGLVTGPDGAPTPGRWLELPDGTAVVELAQVCGLPLLRAPDPLGATTAGLGDVLRSIVTGGARRVLVAVGGSASTDGGAGALVALGLRALDRDGAPISRGGGGLAGLARVDRSGLLPPPPGGVEVLSDVTAPLLGPRGAAATFGPQKGADERQVARLEAALRQWAELLGGDPDAPGAGAAGGTAYGLAAAWGARIVPGASRVAVMTGLAPLLAAADVVLTGEGRFDATSLTGKVVGTLLDAARGAVAIVAGEVDRSGIEAAARAGFAIAWTCSLVDLAGGREPAMAAPAAWLRQAGRLAGLRFTVARAPTPSTPEE